MDSCNSLTQLPDLALYNICTFISSPFDLLNFGNTCTRLRKISMSQSLWWPLAFKWCRGLWTLMEDVSKNPDARTWCLDTLRQYSIPSTGTKQLVTFRDGESWERAESKKFRCLFGMLRLAYKREKSDHPAVLYEQWLYDIGLYKRVHPNTNYMTDFFYFTQNGITQLSQLGQAVERDLRRRKQPNKDPKYYIKRIALSIDDWKELFPSGPHGSICPLLMCPFQDSFANEVSGLPGLAICFSLVVADHVRSHYKSISRYISFQVVTHIIKSICRFFIQDIKEMLPAMELRFGPHCLRSTVLAIVSEGTYKPLSILKFLDALNLPLIHRVNDMITDFSKLLKKYEGIDFIVDEVRLNWRSKMLGEITSVLQVADEEEVARLNLTDSDLIGGDNSRQEMSSAAFISKSGVLVTWHLTGRMRYWENFFLMSHPTM